MFISDEQKEEIKARIDIVDLVSSYGHNIEYKGGKPWVKCPFHTEKTASCLLKPIEGRFHCFGCGKSGDVFEFVKEAEGITFGEAVKKLADKAGIEVKEGENPILAKCKRLKSLISVIAVDFNKMLKAPSVQEAEVARQYIKTRELGQKTIDDFLIGYVPTDVSKILKWAEKRGYTREELFAAGILKDSNKGQPYSYFGGRLVFSIKNKNGEVVAFSGRLLDETKKNVGKYVNSPETLIFKKARTFFAFDKARHSIVKAPHREAIICEGQIDCIRLHINGFTNAVAPLGTAFTEEHASLLKKAADSALLVFDDDQAGHKATIKTAAILLGEAISVRVVSLPNGDDPDSFIRTNGAEAFRKLISQHSESIVKFQIRAEKSKEQDPDSSDAIFRVAKSVLATISHCKSNIMRDTLVRECAKELGLDPSEMMKDGQFDVAKLDTESIEDKNKPIEGLVAGRAEDLSQFPTLAEKALVCYLIESDGKPQVEEIKKSIKTYLPSYILKAPFTKKYLEAFLKQRDTDYDPIRNLIESFCIEEYQLFLSIAVNIDILGDLVGTKGKELKHTDKILYLARQIWHDYLTRLFRLTNPNETADNELRRFIVSSLKTLFSATPRVMRDFIEHFNPDSVAVLLGRENPKPSSQIQKVA